jgi:1-acyl-sn-glycerol-3-phosphate acyltransferase
MNSLRVIRKVVGSIMLTLGAYLLWRGIAVLLYFAPLAQWRWRGWAFRTWAKLMLRLLGANLRVAGAPPQVSFFLVANHLSYVDMLVLAAQMDCIFVAKSEIAGWPLVGFLSRQMQTIFVDRHHKRDLLRVNALLAAAITAKASYSFPKARRRRARPSCHSNQVCLNQRCGLACAWLMPA